MAQMRAKTPETLSTSLVTVPSILVWRVLSPLTDITLLSIFPHLHSASFPPERTGSARRSL